MASVNFPKSFDMTSKSASGNVPAIPQIVRYRSDNSTYTCNSSGATDTVRIEIPTNGRGEYLFPNDSFLTGKFTPTITGLTAGNLLVDTCIYSFFRRIRILQGSSVLVDTNNCGRLWNALRDIQVAPGARSRDEVCLACDAQVGQSSVSDYYAGKTLVSGDTYDFAFVLPAPLLGSLTRCAVPLNLMGGASLFLELELNPSNIATTTRVYANPDGSAGTATTPLHSSSVVFSEIFYSAKKCQINDMYQQALMSVYANGILLPSVSYVSDQKQIASGSTVINEKLAFSNSSVNAVFWWLTPSSIANGTFNGFNLAEGVNCRIGGAINDYTIAVSGSNLLEIKCGASRTGLYFGSQAMLQLQRVFNQSVMDGMGIFTEVNFCSSVDTVTDATDKSKRFVGAYSLEKFDADSSYQSGMNLVGQDTRLVVNMSSATTIAHNLYAYALIDVAYEIRDGIVSVRS